MNCDAFENRLNAVLDQRRDPACDSVLRRHSEECERCSQAMEIQLLWSRAFDSKRRKAVDRELHSPQTARIHNSSEKPRWFVFVAAVVILVPAGLITCAVADLLSERPSSVGTAAVEHRTCPPADSSERRSGNPEVVGPQRVAADAVTLSLPNEIRASTAEGIAGFIVEAHRISSQSGDYPAVRPIAESVSVAFKLIQVPFQAPITPKVVDEPQASIFTRSSARFCERIT